MGTILLISLSRTHTTLRESKGRSHYVEKGKRYTTQKGAFLRWRETKSDGRGGTTSPGQLTYLVEMRDGGRCRKGGEGERRRGDRSDVLTHSDPHASCTKLKE